MSRKLQLLIIAISLLIVPVACSSQATSQQPTVAAGLQGAAITAATTADTRGNRIVIADISGEPTKTIAAFQPFADYVAAHLSQYGITSADIKVVPDMETMARMLKAGEVDLYFDSPYPAMIVSSLSDAQPVLRRWKGGIAEYHTVLFTRTDSGIKTPQDLRGKVIGFEENFSTSGYFLPLTYLLQSGFTLHEQPQASAPVGADTIGYVFTTSDDNTIQWVLSNKVAAGAIEASLFDDLSEETRKGLLILAETETVPRHIMLVRPGVDPNLLNAITNVLTTMHESSEGQAVLDSFEKTARFDTFPTQSSLERMHELYQLIPQQ